MWTSSRLYRKDLLLCQTHAVFSLLRFRHSIRILIFYTQNFNINNTCTSATMNKITTKILFSTAFKYKLSIIRI